MNSTSSNSTPVRAARSLAREQAFAQLALPGLGVEFTVPIALVADGRFVIGGSVPSGPFEQCDVQLQLADFRGGWIVAQGRVRPGCTVEEQRGFEVIHVGRSPRGLLRADVVAWGGPGEEEHVFTPEDWLLDARWSEQHATEVVEHLNDCHLDAIGLLGAVSVGAAPAETHVVAIDPDGLLLGCGRRLAHVPFMRLARSVDGALDEIALLVRTLPGLRWSEEPIGTA